MPNQPLGEVKLDTLDSSHNLSDGVELLRRGRNLIFHIARARTPMPKSTQEYIERVEFYVSSGRLPLLPAPLPG